ncbi:hypothetical protein MMC12_001152 [Toensbergia leucococca]|nr:hypothetical protein [Toensbergia leucococca]
MSAPIVLLIILATPVFSAPTAININDLDSYTKNSLLSRPAMDAITASERALSGGDKVRDEIEHWVCEGEEQVVADTRKQGNSEESGRSDEGRRGCGERAGGDIFSMPTPMAFSANPTQQRVIQNHTGLEMATAKDAFPTLLFTLVTTSVCQDGLEIGHVRYANTTGDIDVALPLTEIEVVVLTKRRRKGE